MSKPLHDSGLAENAYGASTPSPSIRPVTDSPPQPTNLAADSKRTPAAASNREPTASSTPSSEPNPNSSGLWLNGSVVMCACPDCRAPMTVRLWLMIADCWQCGASIELTEEQEQEARRLMAEAESQQRARAPASAPVNRQPQARPPQPQGSPATAPKAPAHAPPPARAPALARSAASPAVPARTAPTRPRPTQRSAVEERLRATMGSRRRRGASVWMNDFFNSTPAWLISLVFHLVLLTLLALWSWEEGDDEHLITLSTTISKIDSEGGDLKIVDPKDEVAFDLPIPKDFDLSDEKVREVVVREDQDARELRLEPGVNEPDLPSLDTVKAVIGGGRGNGVGRALAGRDPRVRVEIVTQEGGTTMTEAAVARGLRWLSLHQHDDGHWSLNKFDHRPGCTCGGGGAVRSDSAGTSLALLPFLGAGQTHLVGRYQENVAKGLRWMITNQKPNGDLRGKSDGNAGMYAHGQATIVLCEAFLMTGDEELRRPAQRAVDFIVESQHPEGGWRYAPGQPGDTSVLGWQLMALQSARAANLTVPDETLELASRFLDSVSDHGGARYSYLRGHSPTHVMTAEALLCRIYLGWNLDQPGLRGGMDYLIKNHLPRERDPNIYYWYYATQAMHHFGGDHWTTWNSHMREILVETQERRGHEAGSWDPRGDHASAGGRLYMTALAICSLEVYYRHLPIFRQLKLE